VDQNGVLFLLPSEKDKEGRQPRRVIPAYDKQLRNILMKAFHDNNTLTRKRKLQPTFSQTGVLKRVTANNRTAIVTIDGVDTPVPVNRMQVSRKPAIANQK